MSESTPSKRTTAKKTGGGTTAKTTTGTAKKATGTAKKTTAKTSSASPAKKGTAKKTTGTAKKTTAKTSSASPAKKSTAKKTTGTAKKTTSSAAKKSAPTPGKRKRNPAQNAMRQVGKAANKAKKETRTTTAPLSKYFKRSRSKAARALGDPEEIRRIAERAAASGEHRTGPFAEILEDFRALIRLAVAYSRGHYRDIPVDQFVLILAGLIYVASPIDLIPDMLPGGFVDDAVVIGWVLKVVRDELHAFREWELGKGAAGAGL